MMKKLLLLSASFLTLTGTAQNLLKADRNGIYSPLRTFQPANTNPSAIVAQKDTLHYFFNKHFFRNSTATVAPSGNQQNELFYTIPTPYTTTTQLTYCGSIFSNSTTISVEGLEAIVARDASSASLAVPVKLYLCNLNGSNLPIMPPLDSVLTTVTAAQNGAWIGGNFPSPVTVTGKFAVFVKNASTIAGDTINPFMNNASTPTSTVPVRERYGESFGLMRVNGNFVLTSAAFGGGADYEFLVAPRVSFNYNAGVTPITPTVCTNGTGSFSNTSSPMSIIDHRQFNFNKFVLYWRGSITAPLTNTDVPQTDSIWDWTFTGSPTTQSYIKNPSVTFNTAGNQTAQLTAKYKPSVNAGFSHPSTSDVATGTVNVNTNAAPVIAIAGNTAICAGNSTTLTASGNTTFTWTNPATTSPFIIVSPNSTTVYTVTADNGGCLGTRTIAVVVSSPANVVVNAPTQACVGKVYTLTATGANSYLWSNSSTASSITAVTTTAGVVEYTVVGTNNGCPPSTVIKQITINALPSVSLTASKNNVCKNSGSQTETITLTGTPSGGVYSGLNVVGAVFNPNTTGTITATYSYTDLATTCSKSATTSIIVDLCSGFEKNAANNDVVVYPNPTINGSVQVRNLEGANTLELYNILGMKISSVKTDKAEHSFDLSGMPSGNYFLKITNEAGSKTVKIVNQQ